VRPGQPERCRQAGDEGPGDLNEDLQGSQRFSWRDPCAVAMIVLLAVAAPALLALSAHSLGIPLGDDWAFRRVLSHFARTGQYRLVGWGSMTLVGQVAWAASFLRVLGPQSWAPSAAVAVLAAGGLVAAYLLARRQLPATRAVACCLVVVALPGFCLSAVSFMTDVPALSGEMACLLLGAFALASSGRQRTWWLAASMLAGLWAFSVREFAVSAPIAVLVTLAATGVSRADRRALGLCAGASLLLVACCTALYIWTSGLAGAQPKHLSFPRPRSVEALAALYFTLSFMVSPLLPGALLRRRPWRTPAAYAGAAFVAGAAAFLLAGHHPMFIGNYLDQRGAGGSTVLAGSRPVLFPGLLWESFRAVAVVGAVALGGIVTSAAAGVVSGPHRRPRFLAAPAHASAESPERLLVALFTWVSAALLVGYGLFFRGALWDRYLWPVAFGAAVMLMLPSAASLSGLKFDWPRTVPSKATRVVTRALTAAFAVLLVVPAGAIVLNSSSYNAAVWSAGEQLVRAGYPAQVVDAGFDWVGSHARVLARPGRRVAGLPGYETWYDRMFPGLEVCAMVSSSPLSLPGFRLLRVASYDEIGFAVPERLYLYVAERGYCARRAGGVTNP
jgi:hypothetical protein